MKKKQFMSKLAALTMAAAMGVTALPATAVFAQTIQTEASDVAVSTTTNVTVDVKSVGEANVPETKAAIEAIIKGGTTAHASAAAFSEDVATEALYAQSVGALFKGSEIFKEDSQTAIPHGGSGVDETPTVSNIKVDGKDFAQTSTAQKVSFTLTYSDGEVYDVTIDNTSKELPAGDAKTELDTYFANKTFTIGEGVVPTSATVAAQLNADKTAGAGGDFSASGVYKDLSAFTWEGVGSQLTKNADGTYSGQISNGTNTYTFKAAKFEEVKSSALADAIAKVSQSTYPNPNSSVSNHSQSAFEKKLAADLNEAAGTNVVSAISSGVTTPANRRNNYNGRYTVTIGSTQLSVALKKSSDEYSAETNKSLKDNAFKGTTPGTAYLKNATTKAYTDSVAEYTFGDHSALSTSVQALTADKPAKEADVKAALEKAISDQLTKDGVANNGVTVSVKSYKDYAANRLKATVTNGTETISGTPTSAAGVYTYDSSTNSWKNGDTVLAGVSVTGSPANGDKILVFADDSTVSTKTSKDATAVVGGEYRFLVTTSIANDFNGWTDGTTKDENANTEVKYVVVVNTAKLKGVATTGITLADQTLVAKKDYIEYLPTTTTKDGSTIDTTVTTPVDVIALKATVTPDNANDTLTWEVTDKDDKATGDAYFVSPTSTNAAGNATEASYNKAGSDDASAAFTVKDTDGKLIVRKAGTYKVTVTSASGKSATATITVNNKFKDVRPGAFYEGPVERAYANGITSGTASDTFGVNDNTTRAQFVTWLYRTAVAKDPTEAVADADLKEQFSDVATDKYYAKAVQWAVDNKITVGTSDTTFSPNADITRAQAVTMLWRYVGKADTGAHGSEADYTKRFTDLPSNATYAAAITWAVNNGITTGTTLTTFSPDATATRAQSITFISNAHLFG